MNTSDDASVTSVSNTYIGAPASVPVSVPVPVLVAAPVVAPVPVVPPAPARLVPVSIDSKSVLSYDIPTKFNKGFAVKGNLSLINPLDISVPEGTRVCVGNNIYVLVRDFVEDVKDIPKPTSTGKIRKELAMGTSIMQSNGVSVALADNLVVELPDACTVRLPGETCLQQIDVPIQLILRTDCTATLVPCPSAYNSRLGQQLNSNDVVVVVDNKS